MNSQILPLQPIPFVPLDSGAHSDLLRVMLRSDAPGVCETSAGFRPLVSIHMGRPVRLQCSHGGESHTGLAIHGDIDVIPPGFSGRWEMQETDVALLLALSSKLLKQVAEDCGLNSERLEIRNRFQVRDQQIEHIGWALKAEVEQGYPGGALYIESMATALAVRLLRNHSSFAGSQARPNGGLSPGKLRQILSYIEDNLHQELSLRQIAGVTGLSGSHLKMLFRKSVGMPVHQYVIRRRVERAALLLRQGKLPMSQIAIESGFAHQSHLAMHMRRILGVSPRDFFRDWGSHA